MMKIGRIKNASAFTKYMEGRTRSRGLDSGLTGYLAGHGDPPGRWVGTAGLAEPGAELGARALARVLDGRDPKSGKRLVEPVPGRSHHPGWEATFAAPKSVSVVWATAAPEQRQAIAAAQSAAVAATMAYAEQHLVYVRRGHAGESWERPAATVSVVYDHGASRSGDPHLHSHVVLANVARRGDGTWGTLESRELFRRQKQLGALYRAELSARLRAMGYSIEKTAGGEFEVSGVPKELRAELSSRHDQVVGNRRALVGDGPATAAQEELAWAQGRPDKGERTDYDAMYQRTQSAAAHHDFDPATIRREDGPGRAPKAPRESLTTPREWWGVSVGRALTEHNSTFSREDVVAALALREPGRLSIEQIEKRVDHALARDRSFVAVGRDSADPSAQMRYTTKWHLDTERQMVRTMQELSMERGREAQPWAVADAVRAFEAAKQKEDKNPDFHLSDEQRAAVKAATAGHRLATIRGAAGAGKTTAMRPIVDAYQRSGYQVHGVALASSAAQVLGQETGMQDTETIARMLARAEHATRPVLNERSVLIVDESGMVDTPQMATLLHLAHEAGAKVILTGDEKQLQAVGAGGGFAAAQTFTKEHGSHADLTENRRQRDEGDRAATAAFEAGRAAEALSHYAAEGKVSVGTGPELVRRMAADWWADAQTHTDLAMMVGSDNATTGALGRQAQRHLKEGGRIGDAVAAQLRTSRWGATDLYVGDQIMLRSVSSKRRRKKGDGIAIVSGDRKAQIANGATARVVGRDDRGRVLVVLDGAPTKESPQGVPYGGSSLALDPAKYQQWHLAYASTVHKSQGATTERVFAHVGAGTAREMAYVAGSRHREELRLYLDGTGTTQEVIAAAARGMARSQEKRLAIDIVAEREKHGTHARLHSLSAGGLLDVVDQRRQARRAARDAADGRDRG